jgi:hypothetical protein
MYKSGIEEVVYKKVVCKGMFERGSYKHCRIYFCTGNMPHLLSEMGSRCQEEANEGQTDPLDSGLK